MYCHALDANPKLPMQLCCMAMHCHAMHGLLQTSIAKQSMKCITMHWIAGLLGLTRPRALHCKAMLAKQSYALLSCTSHCNEPHEWAKPIAMHWNARHYIAKHHALLQALHCKAMDCFTLQSTTLQALHCNALKCISKQSSITSKSLQCKAFYALPCNSLHSTTMLGIALQRIHGPE